MQRSLTTLAKRSVVLLSVLVPAGAALAFLAIQVSSQPRFCGGCHYMTPYYESWKTSTHKDATCVECHIPPGLRSEFRKKYEALAMVARYFTGTYSTNPWAEVDDASCLRSGCHAKRLLLGKEVFQGILFDHQPHLMEMRRGKRLRCTSCHSQIVQGRHIAVTPSTCFLCHFKGVALNEGMGRCTLCHAVPEKTITTAGLAFQHGDVKRFGMQCTACHQGVVKGDGEVLRERCYTCHNDPQRLALFDNVELLHEKHVTEHKVECLHCHMEISHRVPDREAVLTAPCDSCHTSGSSHAAVRDLYRGIGAKGVEPRPAAMYLAGVRCEACHAADGSDSARASAVSCMACHGPRYLTIHRTWQVGLEKRLQGVKGEIEEVEKQLGKSTDPAARERVRDVKHNVALLEVGRAIHNASYAVSVLDAAHRTLADLLQVQGGPRPATTPWLQATYESPCLQCHFGIEYVTRPAFEREFPHGSHVVSARLRCTICHGDLDEHGKTRIAVEDCAHCHNAIRKPMAGLPTGACLRCHTAAIGKVSEKIRFPHEQHAASGLSCATCHSEVEAANHVDFARSKTALPELNHATCITCHAADVPAETGEIPDGAECTRCHLDF